MKKCGLLDELNASMEQFITHYNRLECFINLTSDDINAEQGNDILLECKKEGVK